MATRNKHIRTPYEDERKKHRAAASRHVLQQAQTKKERAADFSTALNCCTEATIRSHWESHFASLSHG